MNGAGNHYPRRGWKTSWEIKRMWKEGRRDNTMSHEQKKSVSGIHTVSFTLPQQRYARLKEIADEAYDRRIKVMHTKDQHNLDHSYEFSREKDGGVRAEVHMYATHPGCARLILTPGSILSGCYDPMRLYQGTQKEWNDVQKKYWKQAPLKSLPKSLDDYSLSRIDLTWDIYMESHEEVEAWIHVFKKSMRSPRYKRVEFQEDSARARKDANKHSCEYCTSTKQSKKKRHSRGKQPETAFKVYDKCYEVNDKKILDQPVLRLELSLTRQSLVQRLKADKSISTEKLLSEAAKNAKVLIWKFVKSAMMTEGEYESYSMLALHIDLNENIIGKKYRKAAAKLVEKCSDCDNLYHALIKAEKKKSRRNPLLKQFAKISLNPVSLPNSFKVHALPSIRTLLEEAME